MAEASVRHDLDPASATLDENIGRTSAGRFTPEHGAVGVVLDVDGREGARTEWQRLHGGGDSGLVVHKFHF